jgi:hypothetical protein
MATSKGSSGGSKKHQSRPAALAIAQKGVQTGGDFASLMSVLMSDLIAGKVTPQVGNAVCNAGRKLLKVVEMQYQYGSKTTPNGSRPDLVLAVAGGD